MKKVKSSKNSKKTKDIVINLGVTKDKKQLKKLVNDKIINLIIKLESKDGIVFERKH